MADWDLSSSLRRPTGHLAAHPWCTFDRTTMVQTRSLDSWLANRTFIATEYGLGYRLTGPPGRSTASSAGS